MMRSAWCGSLGAFWHPPLRLPFNIPRLVTRRDSRKSRHVSLREAYGSLRPLGSAPGYLGFETETMHAMHTEKAARTVIVVSAEPDIEKEVVARAITVRWVHSIKAAIAVLGSVPGETVIITDLALRDGNWRDLIEEVKRLGKPVPVALVSAASTSELWWDALECGIDDILLAPLTVARIREYFDKSFPNKAETISVR